MNNAPQQPKETNVVSPEEFEFKRRKRVLEKRIFLLTTFSGALFRSMKHIEEQTENKKILSDIDRLLDIVRYVDQALDLYLQEKPPFMYSRKIQEITPENIKELEELVTDIEKDIRKPKYQMLLNSYVQDINNELTSEKEMEEVSALFKARHA